MLNLSNQYILPIIKGIYVIMLFYHYIKLNEQWKIYY